MDFLTAFVLFIFIKGPQKIIQIILLCYDWITDYINKRKAHKDYAFIETQTISEEIVKSDFKDHSFFTEEYLKKMAERSPYMAATIDEEGNVEDLDGISPDRVDENFENEMKEENGIIIISR